VRGVRRRVRVERGSRVRAKLVSHLRRSGYWCDRSQAFRPGLSCVAPTALCDRSRTFPPLPRWAKLCRASLRRCRRQRLRTRRRWIGVAGGDANAGCDATLVVTRLPRKRRGARWKNQGCVGKIRGRGEQSKSEWSRSGHFEIWSKPGPPKQSEAPQLCFGKN
jgi:hypothetical protein